MKKLLLIAALSLTGCNEEERKRELDGINGQLPEGCVVADVGRYGAISRVLVVICKGYDTTSTNYYWTSGKTTKYAVTLQIAEKTE
jgi:hypothetical protein